MWLGVIFLLVGGFGSLSAGSVTATSIMALSLASALLLLDLSGKPKPRSAKSLLGFAFLAYRSEQVITWARLVAGALAVGAVLGLPEIAGGTILWIVALLIGASLVIERPQTRAIESTADL